jgi:hypothetical protein
VREVEGFVQPFIVTWEEMVRRLPPAEGDRTLSDGCDCSITIAPAIAGTTPRSPRIPNSAKAHRCGQ